MSANSSVQERIRARKLARDLEAALDDDAPVETRRRLFSVLDNAMLSGQTSLLKQLPALMPDDGRRRKLFGFMQQICETQADPAALIELIAVPVVLATEIGQAGTIASRIDARAVGPLESVMQIWTGDEARVRMLDGLYDKPELEALFPAGTWQLKASLVRALAERRPATAPAGLLPGSISTSGRQGENWLLRFLVGAVMRPMKEGLRQLPETAPPEQATADEWRHALSAFLSMHLEAAGTTFDVLPGPPGQLSYALEQGEAAYCMLELEHYALKRARALAGDGFPVMASFHKGRRLWVVTVGDQPDILWDATVPAWLGDADAIGQALDEMADRAGIRRFDKRPWPDWLAWRQTVAPAADWLNGL